MSDIFEDVEVEDTADQVTEVFGNINLRWYQTAAINETVDELVKHPKSRIMVQLPTGCGKTATLGGIITDNRLSVLKKDGKPLRVLFIAMRHRLLTQAIRTYEKEVGIKTVTLENYKQSSMYRPK